MLLVVSLIILSLQASAQNQPAPEQIALPLTDISTINAERQGLIIAGNDQGNLITYNSQGTVTNLEQVHQAKIILIERVRPKLTSQYVTIDASGLLVVWNEDLSEVQHQEKLLPEGANQVLGHAFRQDGGRHARVRKGYVAVTDGSKIFEYYLNERKVNREITAESGQTIISLTYLDRNLVASVDGKGLFLVRENSDKLKLLGESEHTITMLNNHEQEHGKENDGVAVEGGNTIISFNKHGISHFNILNEQEATITSLTECKSRGRREKEDLIVVGYSDGTLEVRAYFQVIEKHTTNAAIDTIVCEEDSIFYVDQEDNVVKLQLDHLFHTRSSSSAVTTFSFLIVVVICVAYFSNKDKQVKQKRKEEVKNMYEVELQERVRYEPPTTV